uniref:Arylsulfatase B-like n=1 Tax=Saccoglossus kowalevskii TaxID=10224 RepID=A0ABM0ML63_SACKO|nr:PREDICTED: arylsulfatase B-like [Saccoglossus kowalevskii]
MGYPRGLPLNETTIANKLKEAGYSTHLVGKWNCGFYSKEFLPHNRGFDTFFGFVDSKEDHYTHMVHDISDLRRNDLCVADKYYGNYSTIMYGNEGTTIIDNHDTNKPLFLFMSFSAVHEPLQVPSVYEKEYIPTIDDTDRRIYAGMVSCVDEAIANIIETLENKDMLKNSIIVFTSDNGGDPLYSGNNWPLRGWKASNWEGGVRALGFVYSEILPTNARGTDNNELMHITDWFPTLVDISGGNIHTEELLYGVSQWGVIRYECIIYK